MRKHIEVIACDRCNEVYECTRPAKTLQLGFIVMRNGSGSRINTTGRELNLDICSSCSTQFLIWWENRDV